MKLIYYFILALCVLEASIVFHWQVSAQTTGAPIEAKDSDPDSGSKAAEQASSASKKTPKIKRTIRVKENTPETGNQQASAQAGPSITNEGAQNNIDLNPNINVSVPQPIAPKEEKAEPTSTSTAKPPVAEEEKAKPAECPHRDHPHPPHPHFHSPNDSIKIQAPGNSPLFQITINGQENAAVKPEAAAKPEEPRVSIVQPVLVRQNGLSLIEEPKKELFKSYFNKAEGGLIKAANDTTVSVLPLTEFGAKQLISPLQNSPIIMQMPMVMQMPPFGQMPMTFAGYQQPMSMPMPMQMPMIMPMPMMMPPPMWSGYGAGPFPDWHRRPRKHRNNKKNKKEKKEELTTTTPAPVTSTTVEPPTPVAIEPRAWLPRVLPSPAVSTTTPKPVEEIEWETVRVPKIRKKSKN